MLAQQLFRSQLPSVYQTIAFIGFAIAHIGFFVWVIYLVRA